MVGEGLPPPAATLGTAGLMPEGFWTQFLARPSTHSAAQEWRHLPTPSRCWSTVVARGRTSSAFPVLHEDNQGKVRRTANSDATYQRRPERCCEACDDNKGRASDEERRH
ncbi:hypothetical protein GCM10009863_36400 [Streptomyces axinellae]|uniref:Uncharacterized protein n=1 Tax=Streptomyces axinellae TaxID=552788 RepID=A0ABP6CGC6_9ACTN